MSWTCDKENDCENGADETHCGQSSAKLSSNTPIFILKTHKSYQKEKKARLFFFGLPTADGKTQLNCNNDCKMLPTLSCRQVLYIHPVWMREPSLHFQPLGVRRLRRLRRWFWWGPEMQYATFCSLLLFSHLKETLNSMTSCPRMTFTRCCYRIQNLQSRGFPVSGLPYVCAAALEVRWRQWLSWWSGWECEGRLQWVTQEKVQRSDAVPRALKTNVSICFQCTPTTRVILKTSSCARTGSVSPSTLCAITTLIVSISRTNPSNVVSVQSWKLI